jgi:hypothetical protein
VSEAASAFQQQSPTAAVVNTTRQATDVKPSVVAAVAKKSVSPVSKVATSSTTTSTTSTAAKRGAAGAIGIAAAYDEFGEVSLQNTSIKNCSLRHASAASMCLQGFNTAGMHASQR